MGDAQANLNLVADKRGIFGLFFVSIVIIGWYRESAYIRAPKTTINQAGRKIC